MSSCCEDGSEQLSNCHVLLSVQSEAAARSSPEVEPVLEQTDSPVSCADTEAEHELESDTGERAGDGRDPDDAAPGYSSR
jgi:hypothetical protein